MPSGFEEGARRFEVVLGKLQAPAKQGQRGSGRLALQGREIALRSGGVAQFQMRFRGAFKRNGGFRRVEVRGEQAVAELPRSEERRVGKECRARWWSGDAKR